MRLPTAIRKTGIGSDKIFTQIMKSHSRVLFVASLVLASLNQSLPAADRRLGESQIVERIVRRDFDDTLELFNRWRTSERQSLARQALWKRAGLEKELSETTLTVGSTSQFGYDSNPFTARGGKGAGWFEEDLSLTVDHKESDKFGYSIEAHYIPDRYTDYSSALDIDNFVAAGAVKWKVATDTRLLLTDKETWAYPVSDRSNPTTWNALGLDVEQTLKEKSEEPHYEAWTITTGVSHLWFDDSQGDRVVIHAGAKFKWTSQSDPDAPQNWVLTLGVDEAYATYDKGGRHYWQTSAGLGLSYVFTDKLSVLASAQYTNRNDAVRDATFDQWQFFPALTLSYQWGPSQPPPARVAAASGK